MKRLRHWMVLGIALPFLLAACRVEATEPTVTPPAPSATIETPRPTREATPAPAVIPATLTDTAQPAATPPTLTAPAPSIPAGLADGGETVHSAWLVQGVDSGIKPAIALDSTDNPHLTYMSESEHGYIRYAIPDDDGWFVETVAEGYFYGPPAIAVSPEDLPHILWHDHQDIAFQPNLGDAVRGTRRNGQWFVRAIRDQGHDGWDNSIVVDSQGVVHTAGIDPSQFGSPDGVEYAVFNRTWQVEDIGSGPVKYEFGTAIAVDGQDLPAITYYDDIERKLKYARRDADGNWVFQEVDPDLDTGKYSSLGFDSQDRPHVSYFAENERTSGQVRYAYWDGAAWQIEVVDNLDDVQQGPLGARHLTWLALDSQGRPHLAYNDRSVLKYAIRTEAGWQIELVAAAGPHPFSQLVVLDLDSLGRAHLVYAVFTEPNLPRGGVRYAVRTGQP